MRRIHKIKTVKVVKETYSEDKKNLDLPLDKVKRIAIDEDYEKESIYWGDAKDQFAKWYIEKNK